jgi:[ribosomal protein S5]-alanine N-acetyltransferase
MSVAQHTQPRIRLDRVLFADADELIAAHLESRDYHAPWAAPFVDRPGFETWFWRILAGPNISLVVRENASNGIVGLININEIVAGAFRSAFLGYHGMRRFARQGLMTEALGTTAGFAFKDLGLHRLEANIQPGNLASIALVRRVGFHKEGFSPRYLFIDGAWRDHERWALLSDMEIS